MEIDSTKMGFHNTYYNNNKFAFKSILNDFILKLVFQ